MIVTGLITEYNPLHNGHIYHIQKAKEITNADFIIVVMSGNFIQRGTPAIINKYERTHHALLSGADLVIEIPLHFSTGSAEDFSYYALSLLDGLGIVDFICFGSECGDIQLLADIADILSKESIIFSKHIKEALSGGISYPAAREIAVSKCIGVKSDMINALHSPNNILGIEYIKAIKHFNSTIKPITIKREASNYHDKNMGDKISSASAIRKTLYELKINNSSGLSNSIFSNVPDYVYQSLKDAPFIHLNDFSKILMYKLKTISKKELSEYSEVSSDMADRILKIIALNNYNFEELIAKVKTKQYTYSRITRALIHVVLDVKKTEINKARENKYAQYIRILGFRKKSTPLLKEIKDNATLPVISKLTSDNIPALLHAEILGTDIYNIIVYSKYHIDFKNEYTRGLVIL
jgi:Predicted nucleotidyltransferase